MIISGEQIEIPKSGEYKEIVFDIDSVWNTSHWTWIRFEEDSGEFWCGEFRGKFLACCISKKYFLAVILTTSYIYFLDVNEGKIIDYDENDL